MNVAFAKSSAVDQWLVSFLSYAQQEFDDVWVCTTPTRYDLVPSVSAREFLFKRRMWMEFSAFSEETMLERYSLWVQVSSIGFYTWYITVDAATVWYFPSRHSLSFPEALKLENFK